MDFIALIKKKKAAVITIALSAAVLIAAVCFYNVLPDDIKPGKHNPQRIERIKASGETYDSVKIKWAKARNATEYEVFRSDKEDGDYEKCGTVSKNEYIDKKLDTGTEYWYMVRSIKGKKESRYSARVNATPVLDKPVIKGFSTDEGAEITSDKIPGATGYVFYKDGKMLREQPANVCFDGGLKVNERHNYQAAAYRVVGKKKVLSAKSNIVDAGKIKIEMKLEDGNELEKVYVGETIKITGNLKSNVKITKIQAGAMNENGQQWVDGQKYEKNDVNGKEFDLTAADKTLKFGELPEGKYRYRVIAYPEGGKAAVVKDQVFQVEDNPAMAAVNWAIEIANDDSFAYGEGQQAHSRGCYFCGTNSRYKPSGYEKTYCCNPFVLAAFAHGTKDERVLKACQRGACGGMLPSEWDYGCFETVGPTRSVAYDELMPGDFIISDPSAGGPYNHVWMFCGEDKYVDAGHEGWGANTIAVRDNASGYYRTYQRGGCYVMRYKK